MIAARGRYGNAPRRLAVIAANGRNSGSTRVCSRESLSMAGGKNVLDKVALGVNGHGGRSAADSGSTIRAMQS